MEICTWKSPDEFEAFLADTGTGIVFKHSTRCPVSTEAHREVDRFVAQAESAPVFRVLVVENRPTSLAIADRLGVAHASPQVIVLIDGDVTWHASHWDVTVKKLNAAWETIEAGSPPPRQER